MEIVIVSGMSGSGKSQAMDAMEDLGYYCIDNMPPILIKNFIDLTSVSETEVEKACFIVDVRGGALLDDIKDVIEEMKKQGVPHKILFLEASDNVLVRRFNETRRSHPLSTEGTPLEGIKAERKKLKYLRDIADMKIDTSQMKPAELYKEVKDLFVEGAPAAKFTVNVISFGYKHGLPMGADFTVDVRFIPNPYYVPDLKKLTGLDKPVADYVFSQTAARDFVKMMKDMINALIPNYINEGKYHLNLAFGCTGGQHRSVAIACKMAELFREDGDKIVTLNHRDTK